MNPSFPGNELTDNEIKRGLESLFDALQRTPAPLIILIDDDDNDALLFHHALEQIGLQVE